MGGQNHILRQNTPVRLVVARSPRLSATIDAIEVVTDWDWDWDRAHTPTQNFLYQLKAAQSLEIFQPFSPEEQALSDYLSARMAGRRLCEYAWRSYAQSL